MFDLAYLRVGVIVNEVCVKVKEENDVFPALGSLVIFKKTLSLPFFETDLVFLAVKLLRRVNAHAILRIKPIEEFRIVFQLLHYEPLVFINCSALGSAKAGKEF